MNRDPLLRSVETPLHATFHPHGFPLEIETNDSRLLAHAAASFGIFSPSATPYPPIRMRIVCDHEATAGPPWPKLAYRASRDTFLMVSGTENFLTCHAERREAAGFFSPSMLDDQVYFCTNFLESFVYMIIQRHWVAPFHAACVVRDGRGFCLAGNSGSGKSTLAYFCAKSGYRMLSDNLVWVLRSRENQKLLGNPSRLRLRVATRELFPELNGLPVSEEGNERFFAIPTQEMLHGRLVTEAQLGPIVFLERQSGSGRSKIEAGVERVSADEAHRRLWVDRNQHIDEPHVMREIEQTIADLVIRGAYNMRYTSLQEALDGLERVAQLEVGR